MNWIFKYYDKIERGEIEVCSKVRTVYKALVRDIKE